MVYRLHRPCFYSSITSFNQNGKKENKMKIKVKNLTIAQLISVCSDRLSKKDYSDISLFGFYDKAGTMIAYEPGHYCPCLYCRKPLCAPVKTISLMVPGNNRSYFYRLHLNCFAEMEDAGETECYEAILINSLSKD